MLRQSVKTVVNMAARDPVLAGLVVAVMALVTYGLVTGRLFGPRPRECWEPTGENRKLPKDVRAHVKKLCRAGAFMKDLKKSDRYIHLAKYEYNKVWRACESGYGQRDKLAEKNKDVKCPAIPTHPNGKPCRVIAMQASLPCENKSGKCCKVKNGKFAGGCKDPQLAGSRNYEILKAAKGMVTTVDTMAKQYKEWKNNQQSSGGGGGNNVKYVSHLPGTSENPAKYLPGNDKCKYYTASKREDGGWECKTGMYPTGGETTAQYGYPYNKYECAQSQICANKLKDHWKEWKKTNLDQAPSGGQQTQNNQQQPAAPSGGWKCPDDYPEDQGDKCCKPARLTCPSYYVLEGEKCYMTDYRGNKTVGPPPTKDQECENTGKEWGGAGVTIYDDINYSGRKWSYPEGQWPDLGPLGGKVSSVKISPGLKVTLYQNKNFGGGFLILDKDTPNLGEFYFSKSGGAGKWLGGDVCEIHGDGECWNDTADSMQVYK